MPVLRLVGHLRELGFSPYEARCYAGLLGAGAQTGYAIAKRTGVPQPKVYETLRRLVARGAAEQLPGPPTRFTAVDPATLLDGMATAYAAAIAGARAAAAEVSRHAGVQRSS
jgi:sugar-specific transcriptional regulator TrmB